MLNLISEIVALGTYVSVTDVLVFLLRGGGNNTLLQIFVALRLPTFQGRNHLSFYMSLN